MPALTWAPPPLVSPTTITLSNSARKAIMDPTKDYIVQMPSVIDVAGGIELIGGRNVRLIGGKIQFSQLYSAGVNTALGTANRAVYIKGNPAQTVPRTVHVEGLWIAGQYTFEGFNIDSQSEPGLTVQLQNIRIDQVNTLLPGDGSHQGGDAMQNWNGPYRLHIDRFTVANAGYQGFFLQQKAFGTGPIDTYRIKNVNINGSAYVSPSMSGHTNPQLGNNTSAYLVWHSNPSTVPIVVENLYLQKNPSKSWPNGVIWPQDSNATWGAIEGAPPGGDFVPSSTWVGGTAYTSPGYIGENPPLTTTAAVATFTGGVHSVTGGARVDATAGAMALTGGTHSVGVFASGSVEAVAAALTMNQTSPVILGGALYPPGTLSARVRAGV